MEGIGPVMRWPLGIMSIEFESMYLSYFTELRRSGHEVAAGNYVYLV